MPRRASVLPIAIREPSRDHAGRSPPNGDVPTGVPSTLTTQTSERVKRAFEPSGDHGGPLTVSIRRVRPETGSPSVSVASRRAWRCAAIPIRSPSGDHRGHWRHVGRSDDDSLEDGRYGLRRKYHKVLPERPGLTPPALFRLIGSSVFLRLSDVASGLPAYEDPVLLPGEAVGWSLHSQPLLNLSQGSGILFPRVRSAPNRPS